MKIEGVPEGWELVRIGTPAKGDYFVLFTGEVMQSSGNQADKNYPILRKVERPKTYRPFANAEEFKPHRDRWCKVQLCDARAQVYTDSTVYFRHASFDWGDAFKEITFDDGTPFGVEVVE